MKKDWFRGNIKSEHIRSIKISLIIGALILIILGSFFIILGAFYSDLTRIIMFVVGGICFLFSILFPLSSLILIRKYPKYKKIANMFIKKEYFIDFPEK